LVLGYPVWPRPPSRQGNFGRPQDPGWCLNCVEREAVWRQCLTIHPGGTAYAKHAGGRTIGVFVLRTDDS
jgi:hypothetical protein